MKDKRGQGLPLETMGKWLIALGFLALLIAGIIIQREKLFAYLSKFLEILRFR